MIPRRQRAARERARAPTSTEYDSTSRLRTNYGSDQSISNISQPGTPSQNRSPPDIPEHLTTSHEFHRLHQNDPTTKISTNTLTNDEHNGSFEDEDNDEHSHPVDHPDSQSNNGKIIKAFALYDFTGHGNNGSQYVNAATINAGECVDILEDDQGDGWTRIQKVDGFTGFVPSTYRFFSTLFIVRVAALGSWSTINNLIITGGMIKHIPAPAKTKLAPKRFPRVASGG